MTKSSDPVSRLEAPDKTTIQDEQFAADRRKYVDALLESSARKKLVISGPGTGKTNAFKQLFKMSTGPNLALTFINSLVDDLSKKLGEIADVYTFHGFCRRLLYSLATPGITRSVDYYPPLTRLVAEDISLLGQLNIARRDDVESAFHNLDNTRGIIDATLRSSNYYNSVGHTDAVYRVLQHLENHPNEVPDYSQIVVDEYQDFSLLEVKFISLLSSRNPILVAGDDDQALYEFKHASAIYLRSLVKDRSFSIFELPYCSRCTSIIVEATKQIVMRAESKGLLKGRIDKPFICYMPSKREDSGRYPAIVHVHCSVERNNAPYMAKYINQKIREIPPEEIRESHEQGYPTVLVTGPVQFTRRIYDYLSHYFEDIELKESKDPEIRVLDGYYRLDADNNSRLGWRIICHNDQPPSLRPMLRKALEEGKELSNLIPEKYRKRHLTNVGILRKVKEGLPLTAQEVLAIESALKTPFLDFQREVRGDRSEPSKPIQDHESNSVPPAEPKIVVTSLVGAKGLQAGHVFVVGVNNQHLPMDNRRPSNNEVCCFLVAITRAQKCCYLVSCQWFGNQRLEQSIFIDWIDKLLQTEVVDKEYFLRSAPS